MTIVSRWQKDRQTLVEYDACMANEAECINIYRASNVESHEMGKPTREATVL